MTRLKGSRQPTTPTPAPVPRPVPARRNTEQQDQRGRVERGRHLRQADTVRHPLQLLIEWLVAVLAQPVYTVAADVALVCAPMAVRIGDRPERRSAGDRRSLAGPPPGWVVHPGWLVLGVVVLGLAAGALAAAVVVR